TADPGDANRNLSRPHRQREVAGAADFVPSPFASLSGLPCAGQQTAWTSTTFPRASE
ncbi:mCG58418, partial [Mus musculus]